MKEVVFIIGCGGSGKSYSIRNNPSMAWLLNLPTLNSDSFIESHADYEGNGGSKSAMDLHPESKAWASAEWQRLLAEGQPFVFDGTGKTPASMRRKLEQAWEAGFTTRIIWVKAPLSACLARNAKRSRTLPEGLIRKTYAQVAAAIPTYQEWVGVEVLLNG